MESLKANPAKRKISANNCIVLPLKCAAISLKPISPVVPYSNEIPKSKIPEAKADDKIIFKPASDDFNLSRSKLQSAASGMVDNSRPRYSIIKLPDEIMKSIPSSVHKSKM